MTSAPMPVSDMLATVKAREIQRGLLAELRDDPESTERHYLAAAHLELVLAADYQASGESELSRRSRISAASCYWRAGEIERARELLDDVRVKNPAEIDSLIVELEREYPAD
jgi:hypothetical protein